MKSPERPDKPERFTSPLRYDPEKCHSRALRGLRFLTPDAYEGGDLA